MQVLIAGLPSVQKEGQQQLDSELLAVQRHCQQLTGRLQNQMMVLHLEEQKACLQSCGFVRHCSVLIMQSSSKPVGQTPVAPNPNPGLAGGA